MWHANVLEDLYLYTAASAFVTYYLFECACTCSGMMDDAISSVYQINLCTLATPAAVEVFAFGQSIERRYSSNNYD